MIKDKLQKLIKESLKKLGIKNEITDFKHPANPEYGDYATGIALKLAKKIGKNPMLIAEKIAKNIPQVDFVSRIEVVKPGFINFWIADSFLLAEAKKYRENKIIYPKITFGKEAKVMVEFAHPNTLKLFHIGHLRNIITGEAVVRILEAVGNRVVRTNYQGDVGLHIAKTLWRLKKIVKTEGETILQSKDLLKNIKLLGKAYAEGNKAYETNEKAKEEIIAVNEQIYNENPEIFDLWKKTRQWSLDYFNTIYKRVYSRFDRLYFESEMSHRALTIAYEAMKKGILERSDGAIIFNGKKYGLDTRVFVNAFGFPTYEGKELALAEKEFSDFGVLDRTIHVVGPEQTSFFKVTFKVEELLDPEKYDRKQYHLIYGWVRLKTGKMSSREGNVVEGPWLLDETKKKIKETYHSNDKIAEALAIAAVKYSFLKTGIQNDIAFDFKESISLDGNSGPYLIYTFVRTRSVLEKGGKIDNFEIKNMLEEEKALLRIFYQFPEVVGYAAANLAPNYIASYLFDLAQKYNLFYQKYPILKTERNLKNFRLMLTETTSNILKEGLRLLGIETIEKM